MKSRWLLLFSCLVLWAPSAAIHAQSSPPTPQISVTPPDGSILVTETTNSIFAKINNFSLFTNVTIVGTFGQQQNIPFLDDGTPPDQTAGDGTFSANIITPRVRLVATNIMLTLVVSAEVISTNDPGQDPPPPPVTVAATNSYDYVIVPRPANDDFTNAFKIVAAGGVILATNNYASLEPGEPMHAQVSTVAASVWWTWSPAVNTNVLIDMAGSSFDPVLAVYTGLVVTNLLPIASSYNDTVNHLKAHVNFDAKAGVTYRIAVAGHDTNGVGNIRLRVAPGARPDTNGPLATIISPAAESLFTNDTVTLTGTAKDVQPNGTGLDKVLLQVNGGTQVLATGTANWSGQVTLTPGTNIVQVFAQDIAGNLGPPDMVVLRFINPVNDNFADAFDVTDIAGTIIAVNQRASLEPGEPLHAGNEGGHSIWYRFRAPVNGTLFLTTTNSDFDTLLDLFTGDSLTNLTSVASNDDAFPGSGFSQLTHAVVSNQVYYIAIDGYGGAFGNIQLQYVFTTTERYFSLTVNQPLGGSVSPASGLYLANSTLYLTAAASRDFEFVGWNGTVSSTNNPLTLVMDQNYNLDAQFVVKSYTDGFESGGLTSLSWSSGGNSPWLVQNAIVSSGQFAARSGVIGDSQSSSLFLVTNLLSGTAAFDLRVSSENGWDFLEFYLNGVRLQRWSGDVGWTTFLFRVPAGLSTLEWRYTKDANFSDGLDAAFIDNLYLPLPDSSIAGRLSILLLPDGHDQVQVQGLSGRDYVIQAAASFGAWNSVSTNASDSGIIQWTDPQPANQSTRFYRAITQ